MDHNLEHSLEMANDDDNEPFWKKYTNEEDPMNFAYWNLPDKDFLEYFDSLLDMMEGDYNRMEWPATKRFLELSLKECVSKNSEQDWDTFHSTLEHAEDELCQYSGTGPEKQWFSEFRKDVRKQKRQVSIKRNQKRKKLE